ncbi:hypothetical protein [Nocardiopsis alba]|uniref:hypothetical protein n=1 Tax=Nocardiopsis alba TaxID=53437 RepID=UPI003D7031BD
MYRKAGIPEDARSNLQGLIRYHMSETLRAYMEANGYTDADFEYYGLDRQSAKDKARDRQRDKAERLAASVLALDRVAPERLPAASATVVGQTAGSLRALSENAAALSSLSVLQGDERDALLRDLEAVETAAAVIRASL